MAIVFNNLSAGGGGSKLYQHNIHIYSSWKELIFNIVSTIDTKCMTIGDIISLIKNTHGEYSYLVATGADKDKKNIYTRVYAGSSNTSLTLGYFTLNSDGTMSENKTETVSTMNITDNVAEL